MSLDVEARISDWLLSQPGFDDFELNRLGIRRNGSRSSIEILMDRKSGSITLDECARWNRLLSNYLEQTDWFPGPFLVEISSPGADRPLTRARDFERVVGRTIKVRYQAPGDTAREALGVLERCDDAGIALRAQDGVLDLSLSWILQARQEIIFSKGKN